MMCNEKVRFDTWLNQDLLPAHCKDQPRKKRVYLWSEEKIPTIKQDSEDLFSAPAYAQYYLNKDQSTCKYMAGGGFCHALYRVSTHQHVFSTKKTESRERIEAFNLGMRGFFENECGNTHYIDVFNMTNGLSKREEATSMAYESNTYGLTVNLIKVSILNAIIL